jgi:ParB family chromosome partitioning protein
MAPKKTGLGKGLGSLIADESQSTKVQVVEKIVEKVVEKPAETILKLRDIEPNRNQPRKMFNEDSLYDLAESIKQHGIIQPLIVTKRDKYYEIIAGERRWRAAKMAGLKEVPVIIKDFSDQEIVEVALIENIQREDLNPIEEAQAYQHLIQEYNLKQDEVAERVSKSRTAITNSMRLLKLDERVQEMVIDERISSGHARALLGIADTEKQYLAAQKVFDEQLSVRQTEKMIKDLDKPIKEVKKPENDFVYKDYEEKLNKLINTHVTIKNKGNNKGKIEIDYYSLEEFERIVELFENVKVE